MLFRHSGISFQFMRRGRELNPRIRDLQSLVLPLDDAAFSFTIPARMPFCKSPAGEERLLLEELVDVIAIALAVVRHDLHARDGAALDALAEDLAKLAEVARCEVQGSLLLVDREDGEE